MKKTISKIWGIGIVVALLASLVLVAAPASAAGQPLQWNQESVPSSSAYILMPAGASDNVSDIAVGGDGTTIYAVTGNTTVYKSVNGGLSWSAVPTSNGGMASINPTLVAVAPDNNNYVAICDTAALTIYITTNGGATWGSLGTPQQSGQTAAGVIADIDMSAVGQGQNYLAVAGAEAGTLVGDVWYYGLGIGGSWKQAKTFGPLLAANGWGATTNTTLAVKFSPNFPSDTVLTAVTNNTTAGKTYFEIFSINSGKWNGTAALGAGYPAEIYDGTNSAVSTAAAIALDPGYLGGDETTRNAFVGLTTASATTRGIYRLMDVNVAKIKSGVNAYSVAYDGTTLVSGIGDGNTVYRSANAMETSPTFYPTAATKSPGFTTNTNTVVAFAGTSVVAGTKGDECAFALSTDSAASFNDISLIRATLTTMEDVAVAADGSLVYLVTKDATATSVWRYDTAWKRVLSLSATGTYIARLAPANAQVIYIAQYNGTAIYYSKAGGDTKWYTRTGPGALADLAVEDDNVAYMGGYGSVNVQKTMNGGFTWTPPTDTKIGGNIYTLAVISAGNILVGGANSYVSYSTDGGTTFTLILQPVASTVTNVQVTANGLAAGKTIVAVGLSGAGVYVWTVGQSMANPWTNQNAPPISANATGMNLAVQGNMLYVASYDGNSSSVYRSNAYGIPNPPPFDTITATGLKFTAVPSSLRVSSTTYSNKLWAISNTTTPYLYSFDDTLMTAVPGLTTPADKAVVSVNEMSGSAYNVAFTWPAVPGVIFPTGLYELKISLDAMGDQAVYDNSAVGNPGPVISIVPTPTSATPVSYMPGITYYWKVKVKAPVSSGWSAVRTFTVQPGPGIVPSIEAPVNGASISATAPAFSWSPVSGTTQYQFQLSLNTDFMPTVADQKVASAGVRPLVKLDTGLTYFWRVRAFAPVTGDWSAIANFTVTEPVEAAPPEVNVTVPKIEIPTITVPPAQVTVQPAAPTPSPISSGLLWAVIIIGAVLVIALIVLIVRTRRTV